MTEFTFPSNRQIIIEGKDGKRLFLEFEDELKISGDLPLSEAAKVFIDYLKENWGWRND